jgi:hypothetical protein
MVFPTSYGYLSISTLMFCLKAEKELAFEILF